MSKRIYVGNLSYQTTENDLTTLFEQAGQVDSVNIITDRDTGRSKGFGFVEMSAEDADKAIAQFNGTEVNGRALTVNEARPREERSGGGRGFGGGGEAADATVAAAAVVADTETAISYKRALPDRVKGIRPSILSALITLQDCAPFNPHPLVNVFRLTAASANTATVQRSNA